MREADHDAGHNSDDSGSGEKDARLPNRRVGQDVTGVHLRDQQDRASAETHRPQQHSGDETARPSPIPPEGLGSTHRHPPDAVPPPLPVRADVGRRRHLWHGTRLTRLPDRRCCGERDTGSPQCQPAPGSTRSTCASLARGVGAVVNGPSLYVVRTAPTSCAEGTRPARRRRRSRPHGLRRRGAGTRSAGQPGCRRARAAPRSAARARRLCRRPRPGRPGREAVHHVHACPASRSRRVVAGSLPMRSIVYPSGDRHLPSGLEDGE